MSLKAGSGSPAAWNGWQRWRKSMSVTTSLARHQRSPETLFVAAGYALLAIDAETGVERWSVPLRFAGSCSPVVDEPAIVCGDPGGHISAFRDRNGEEVWHCGTTTCCSDRLPWRGRCRYCGWLASSRPSMPGRGARCGKRPARRRSVHDPCDAGGVAFVATNAFTTAFELKTGAQLWRRDVGGESSPAAGDRFVFLGGDDQSVRALDATTGETRWAVRSGTPYSHPSRLRMRLCTSAAGRRLHAIDRDDGSTLWTHVLEALSQPTLWSWRRRSSRAATIGTFMRSRNPNSTRPEQTEVSIRGKGFYLRLQVVQCAGRSERPASSGRGLPASSILGSG